jgi:D-xylose transport system permease protein
MRPAPPDRGPVAPARPAEGSMETTTVQAQPAVQQGGLGELLVRSLKQNTKQYTMALALVAIWVIFSLVTDGVFLTPRNLSNLFVQTVITAILAIGMVLVIVAGHIDLSVGSVLGFTGAVCAMAMIEREWGVTLAIAVTLLAGLLIGAWHGFWIAYRKVPAFIVTLASMLAFRGLIIGITGGQTQGLEMAPESTAEAFKLIGQGYLPTLRPAEVGQVHDTSLIASLAVIVAFVASQLRKRAARRKFGFSVLPAWAEALRLAFLSAIIGGFAMIMVIYLGVPWSVVLLLALAVLFTFVAGDTTFGRHLYAIGGNREAAFYSGINIDRHLIAVFTLMGVMCGIAGIVLTARVGSATSDAGRMMELDAIAAAVIGGTSLLGGQGTIWGALLGALVMASLDNGMSLMNTESFWQPIIKGVILILAVGIDMASRKGRGH